MKQRMATGHNAMLAPVANWDLPTRLPVQAHCAPPPMTC